MGHLIAISSLVLGGLTGLPTLTLPPHAAAHQDPASEADSGPQAEPGFNLTVAWKLPARRPYAGEIFPVSMEIAVPAGTEHGQLLQLFPQPLGLPLQLSGFEALASSRLMAAFAGEAPSAGASQSVALDGEIAQAAGPLLSQGPHGRVSIYTIKRWFKAPRSTTLELPGPGARFAVATEFREDFVQGRVPVDRQTKSVSGSSAGLEIRPLPEEGRPFKFKGFIGSFGAEAITTPLSLSVGDTLTFSVVLSARDLPVPPDFSADSVSLSPSDSFREQGRSLSSDPVQGTTTITFSLVALAPAAEAKAEASWTLFDPSADPPGYSVLTRSSSVVQIRPAKTAQPGAGAGVGAEGTPGASAPGEAPNRPTPYWTIAVGAFIFALAVASVVRRHWPRKAANSDHQDPAKNA